MAARYWLQCSLKGGYRLLQYNVKRNGTISTVRDFRVLSVSDCSIAYIVLSIDFISTLYREVIQKRGNRWKQFCWTVGGIAMGLIPLFPRVAHCLSPRGLRRYHTLRVWITPRTRAVRDAWKKEVLLLFLLLLLLFLLLKRFLGHFILGQEKRILDILLLGHQLTRLLYLTSRHFDVLALQSENSESVLVKLVGAGSCIWPQDISMFWPRNRFW